jgi:putative endonuclease
MPLHQTNRPCVYILANRRNGTIYVGVTTDLVKRIYEHKNELFGGFTKEYGIKQLVWYETHDDLYAARARERAIKKWNRQWKIELIEKVNPYWLDLSDSLN